MKGYVLCMLYTDEESRASLKGAEKYAGAAVPDAAAVPLAKITCDAPYEALAMNASRFVGTQ
jgi:hypothetical protein